MSKELNPFFMPNAAWGSSVARFLQCSGEVITFRPCDVGRPRRIPALTRAGHLGEGSSGFGLILLHSCWYNPDMNLPNVFPVAAMLVCYWLEKRSQWFILAFAGTCALGAAYQFARGGWAFALIEVIWSIVSLQRWRLVNNSSRNIGIGG